MRSALPTKSTRRSISKKDVEAIAQAVAIRVLEILDSRTLRKEADIEKERVKQEIEREFISIKTEPKVIRLGGIV